MFKNSTTGSFADTKLTENYVEMTPKELEWFEKYGSEGFKLTDEGFNINPDYEAEQAQKEREELDKLSLTGADVERALYVAKGIDFDDLKKLIEEKMPSINMKALNIEFRANNYFRGATLKDGTRLFDVIGALLDYTADDMDYLFQNGKLPADANLNDNEDMEE